MDRDSHLLSRLPHKPWKEQAETHSKDNSVNLIHESGMEIR